MNEIFIYGAGSVGKLVAEIIRDLNKIAYTWKIVGFLDDDDAKWGSEYANIKVLGGIGQLEKNPRSSVIIGFSDPLLKKKVAERLDKIGARFPQIIHPSAWIADRVQIEEGTVVYPGVCIDCDVTLGKHTTINKNATLGHDSNYGSYLTVSPGVNLGGFAEVGEGVEFGIGSTTIQRLKIGAWTKVGAGAVVTKDLPANCTAVGVPAKPIKFRDS
jgi:sugar O-acyltransferase (sialic acid O-acetyltransferase NeuD family)